MKSGNRVRQGLRGAQTPLIFFLALSVAASGFPLHASADEGRLRPPPRPPGPGPGPAPNPPNPNPNPPTPAPQPPTPPPVDTSGAMRDGISDGQGPGGQEGRERGNDQGERNGRDEGYREGFNSCEREERQRAYDSGYSEGFRQGSVNGDVDGRSRGESDGRSQGERDGRADGEARADRDADRDATPPGTAQGIEEAERSDASARGRADGLVAGDRDARKEAIAQDYPRGRKDFSNERFAEPIQFQDDFAQKGATRAASGPLKEKSTAAAAPQFDAFSRDRFPTERHGVPEPDYRYSRPLRNYPTPQENQAYQQGYRQGYRQGFQSSYSSSFDSAYQRSYRQSERRGCDEARRRSYRGDYDRGFILGRDTGYRRAYDYAYDAYFRSARDAAFGPASDAAYRETYPYAYDRHFEEARSAAYAQRTGELYRAAFNRAHEEKFNEVYPGYAEQEYRRGRKDEAQDFAERPVRLLAADATETNGNGLFEPGEPVRFRVVLRNFANEALQGRDVKLKVEPLDSRSAVITESEATLVRDLRSKSSTSVREALEIRLNESAAEKVSAFRVTAFYQGRNIGEIAVNIRARFQLSVAIDGNPAFKDGISTSVRFRLTNVSEKATDSILKIRFQSNPQQLVIDEPEKSIPGLASGETRMVEYWVTARTADASLHLPFAVSVNGSTTRRIGLLDETRQVPIVNDYRIQLVSSAEPLRKAGVTRVLYQIRNSGSRLLYKSLQLKVSVKEASDPTGFAVIGPNPQYLLPLEKGETTQFLVPIAVKSENPGGVLELELQEDGQTVVIHQQDFRLKDVHSSQTIQ